MELRTLIMENIKIIVLFSLLFMYGCNAQQAQPNNTTEIIGTWKHESDPENIWEFTNTGICKWLNSDDTIEESFTYTISYTSPQCGYEVKTNGSQFSYLKMIDQEGDEYCYEIQVDSQSLSINYLGTAKYDLYNKQ